MEDLLKKYEDEIKNGIREDAQKAGIDIDQVNFKKGKKGNVFCYDLKGNEILRIRGRTAEIESIFSTTYSFPYIFKGGEYINKFKLKVQDIFPQLKSEYPYDFEMIDDYSYRVRKKGTADYYYDYTDLSLCGIQTYEEASKKLKHAISLMDGQVKLSIDFQKHLYNLVLKDIKKIKINKQLIPYCKSSNTLKRTSDLNLCAISSRVSFKNDNLKFNFCDIPVTYHFETDTIQSERISYLISLSEFCKENKQRLITCVKLVNTYENASLEISKNKIVLKGKYLGVNFKFSQQKPSARELKKEIRKKIETERIKSIELEKKYKKYAKESGLYGNIIAEEVIRLICANPDCMTAIKCSNALRGLQVNCISKLTDACGIFKDVTDEYIHKIICQMYTQNIIGNKTITNSHRSYDVLKAKGSATYFFDYQEKLPKSFSDYSDRDWLNYITSDQISIKKDTEQMDLMNHFALCCMYQTEVAAFIANKPDYWLNYMEAMEKVEKGIARRYWKNLRMATLHQKKSLRL